MARIHDALQTVLEPVRAELAAIDARIAELTAELDELRKERADAVKVIRIIDPTIEPPRAANPRVKSDGHPRSRVAQDKLIALEAWLRENVQNGADITSRGLVAHPEFDLMSRATATYALNELRDRGVLRLDRKRGQGGRLYYKLAV